MRTTDKGERNLRNAAMPAVLAGVAFGLPLLFVGQPLPWTLLEWLSLIALYSLLLLVFGRGAVIEIGVVVFVLAAFLAVLAFAFGAVQGS
jgi:hypothetical protein